MDGQNEEYIEYIVKKAPTAGKYIFAFLCAFTPISASVVLALAMPERAYFSLLFFCAALTVYCCFRKYFSVEYEYRIVGGVFEADAIYGKRKRVRKFSAELKKAAVIAPRTERYQQYYTEKYRKIFDFTGGSAPQGEYFMVVSDADGQKTLCFFEVSKKTLAVLKRANPTATVMSYGLKNDL